MNGFSYFLLILSLFCHAGVGRLFTPSSFAASLLTGLTISGLVAAFLARLAPIFIFPFFIIYLLLGAWLAAKELRQRNWLPTSATPILIGLAVAFFFREFHYMDWTFDTHDVAYFGPSLEMLLADYFGNLRVSTVYPAGMSSFHLLPCAVIASLAALVPHPNMSVFIEARYLLVIVFLTASLSYIYQNIGQRRPLIFLLACTAAFSVFNIEIFHNLKISSFYYVFLLTQIFVLFLTRKELSHEIIYFVLALITAKAPIIYSALALAGTTLLFYRQRWFHWQTMLFCCLIALNVISWGMVRSNHSRSFEITHTFQGWQETAIELRALLPRDTLVKWLLPETTKTPAPKHFTGFSSIEPQIKARDKSFNLTPLSPTRRPDIYWHYFFITIFYIVIKYYGFTFLFLALFFWHRKEKWLLVNYLGTSILGWLLLKNGGSMNHQMHGIVLAGILGFWSLINLLILYPRFLPAGIILAITFNFIIPDITKPINYYPQTFRGLAAIDCTKVTRDGFYVVNSSRDYAVMELESMICGVRLRKSDITSWQPEFYKIQQWAL